MNKILKGVLEVAREVAEETVPGAKAVSKGVEAIIRKDDNVGAAEGALDVAEGAIKVIEEFKGADVADEVQLRAGIAMLEAGFAMVRRALKPSAAQ